MAEPATLQLCLVLSLVAVFFSLLAFAAVLISRGLPVPPRRGHQPRMIDLTGQHMEEYEARGQEGTRPKGNPPNQGSAGRRSPKPGKSPPVTSQTKHRPF